MTEPPLTPDEMPDPKPYHDGQRMVFPPNYKEDEEAYEDWCDMQYDRIKEDRHGL